MKNLLSTVSHKIHHHEDENPENSFQLNYDVAGTTVKKKKTKKAIKEDEYKSKWDQFCDFTSLNGFRLLSSKFSLLMRIITATVMLVATCGLCWNVSGAFVKYFNPSGQKNTVVHQGEYERMELPKIRFCHQSKNARTSVDPEALHLLHEDSRRLLYLYNTEGLTTTLLKNEKLPYLSNFMTDTPNLSSSLSDCAKDFFQMQQDCKDISLYPSFCSLFRLTNEYLTFKEMLQTKNVFDDCVAAQKMTENANEFYCCRLQKAVNEFQKIKNENFEEFLVNANKEGIFLWSSSKNITESEDWESLYGKCWTYSLNHEVIENFYDGKPLYSVDFLLSTFAFDIISDNGVVVSFVSDNYRTNEFLLISNAQTTIKVKEFTDISDFDCTSQYPSICSDAREPYNDRICEECYNSRKNCNCNNPLRKSDNFGKIKDSNCNVHDAILCLLQKTSPGQEICPNPCLSKYTKSFTTLDTLNISTLNISKEESAKIKSGFIQTINNLINTLDSTSSVFPLRNHSLWEAVYYLEEIFEEFWRILFLITNLSGKPISYQSNITQLIPYFQSVPQKESKLNMLIENYYKYILDGINSSLSNDPKSIVINHRSIEVNILLGKIPNPPAIVNFYVLPQNFQKTIQLLDTLKSNIDSILGDTSISEAVRKIILELKALKIFQGDKKSVENTEIIIQLKNYLEEFQWFTPEFHQQSLAQLTLSFITKKFSKIDYFQSYSFWNFLSDVGGILGLYFGLTMVTIYEIITFSFIDREPPESFTRKEKKLTRKSLYPKIMLSDEPIPSIL